MAHLLIFKILIKTDKDKTFRNEGAADFFLFWKGRACLFQLILLQQQTVAANSADYRHL